MPREAQLGNFFTKIVCKRFANDLGGKVARFANGAQTMGVYNQRTYPFRSMQAPNFKPNEWIVLKFCSLSIFEETCAFYEFANSCNLSLLLLYLFNKENAWHYYLTTF